MAGELNIFSNPVYDFEFLGFSFNGRHSSEFGLTVVSPSDRTQENIFTSFEDKTVEVSGRDGAYYFGTEIKRKELGLTVAFDRLTSKQYREVINWLNPKIVGKLIFDEKPYKYYMAKISSQPNFSFIPFEEEVDGEKIHVFKGDISISFIAHDPYGYCDTSLLSEIEIFHPDYEFNSTDPNLRYYPYVYGNIPGWYFESGLIDYPESNLVSAGTTNFLNLTSGIIQKDSLNADFFNCGTLETYPSFSFSIAQLDLGDFFQITNNTTGKYFRLLSPLNISASLTGSIQVNCDPTKGLITGIVNGQTYNLGSIHEGDFIYLQSGSNELSINKAVLTGTNFTIQFKNKYW